MVRARSLASHAVFCASLSLAGCAAATPTRAAGATPLAAPAGGGPGGPRGVARDGGDLLDRALIASGLEEAAARGGARDAIEERLRPIVAEVMALPDVDLRAPALLRALHRDWLRTYDARATTLIELLEDGRYNCLSAAVLYNVAAERAGVTASGELLPTHARSIVAMRSGARVVVEATSPHGFNPDLKTRTAILAQVATPAEPGQRAIVAEAGAFVPSSVLAGTIFVNRASLAQESGDLARAEQLFAAAEATAGTDETRVVLRDQRAALLTQLAATDLLARDGARTARAYATMLAVLRLGTRDAAVRSTAEHNTRAAAERVIAAHADQGRDDAILRVLDDLSKVTLQVPIRAALTAFAWSELGRLRAQRGDFEGTLVAIDRGLEAELSAGDQHLTAVLRENRLATLRRFALTTAKAGQLDRSLEIVRRIEALPGLTPSQRQETGRDRARIHQIAAEARFGAGDLRGGVALYRQALALAPDDETARHNLVAGLQQVTVDAVNAGRCADVRSELDELRRLVPADPYADKADARCLLHDASARLEQNDAAGAVELLRRASTLRPDDPAVRTNLGLGLLALARAHLLAGQCAPSRAALAEAKAIQAPQTGSLESAIARACRR